MRILGLEITRAKKALPGNLTPVDTTTNRGWWVVAESYGGAWQQNDTVTLENILTHPTVFACVTLISTDIAKMRLRLVEHIGNDVWVETESPAFSPLLRKPNSYQCMQQFLTRWQISLLVYGNAYVLKERDSRGVVVALYLLDPCRVRPLVAPDGSVYYELKQDYLATVEREVPAAPASEIIHDRINPLYHDLVGISPITAAWASAKQGITIQNNSATFHANGAMPGGFLLVPGPISQATADTLKTQWESQYSGDNSGKVAVLGDNMKFEVNKPMTAVDAQVVDQLKWGDEAICRAFRVPAYMVGVGGMPNYSNIEALSRQYYGQCLGEKAVSIENLLDEGIGLAPNKIDGRRLGVEFNRDDLWLMDTATMIESEKAAERLKTPNESRRRLNLPPVTGGDTVYRQQQDFSIEALNRRDEERPAPNSDSDTQTAPNEDPEEQAQPEPAMDERAMADLFRKELEMAA